MIEFDKYLVFQCPACGKWQGKQNNKFTIGMSEESKSYAISKLILKCVSEKCGKSTKFKDSLKGGIRARVYWCKLPQQAKLVIQELEKRKVEA